MVNKYKWKQTNFRKSSKKSILISSDEQYPYQYLSTSFKSWCLDSYPEKNASGKSCSYKVGEYNRPDVSLPYSLFQMKSDMKPHIIRSVDIPADNKEQYIRTYLLPRIMYTCQNHGQGCVPSIKNYFEQLKQDVGEEPFSVRSPGEGKGGHRSSNVDMSSSEIKSIISQLKENCNEFSADAIEDEEEPPSKKVRIEEGTSEEILEIDVSEKD